MISGCNISLAVECLPMLYLHFLANKQASLVFLSCPLPCVRSITFWYLLTRKQMNPNLKEKLKKQTIYLNSRNTLRGFYLIAPVLLNAVNIPLKKDMLQWEMLLWRLTEIIRGMTDLSHKVN